MSTKRLLSQGEEGPAYALVGSREAGAEDFMILPG